MYLSVRLSVCLPSVHLNQCLKKTIAITNQPLNGLEVIGQFLWWWGFISAHESSVVPCQPNPQLFVFLPGQENSAISHLVTSLCHSESSGLTILPVGVVLSGARKYVLGPNFQSISIVRTNHMWEFWFSRPLEKRLLLQRWFSSHSVTRKWFCK